MDSQMAVSPSCFLPFLLFTFPSLYMLNYYCTTCNFWIPTLHRERPGLLQLLISLIFTKKRRVMQIVPERLRRFWDEWELRVLVLLSLFLQIVLIITGNRRKYKRENWIRIILWLAYLSADWVATVSLGILSRENIKDESLDPNYVITAFWAPFLLVHLGGPDTITAYSLEDNELWLRHLLGLLVQVGVAFYVFFKSWNGTKLNFLAFPLFVAGMVKYGERTWVLRSASRNQFRDSMLRDPDPGPNFANFMDEYSSKEWEGYKVSIGPVIDDVSTLVHWPHAVKNNIIPEAQTINDAYYSFKIFKPLFADLILSFQDQESSRLFFTEKLPHQEEELSDQAFNIIEVELGFIYDLLYTKATLIYSCLGSSFRFISLCSTISAFATFLIIDKHQYSGVEVSITYLLLVGAIVLEFYAIILLLSSDWTIVWLSKLEVGITTPIYKAISFLQLCRIVPANKRWSKSMSQYNLISFCLKDKPTKCSKVQKCFRIYEWLEKRRYRYSKEVCKDLKKLVFNQLEKKVKSTSVSNQNRGAAEANQDESKQPDEPKQAEESNQRWTHKGDQALKEMECYDELGWSVQVEFDQSILLWHIATTLCYYAEKNQSSDGIQRTSAGMTASNQNQSPDLREMSNSVSNYMLYLLVMCPFMLPNGIGQIRYQDTCAEAIDFFKERKSITDKILACTKLLQVKTDSLPSQVKGYRSKSVLFDACRLAKGLRSSGKEWETTSRVWVEMLSYAASQCRWNYHAQQLRRGGEFLTHVWLLMAHLGITEHFQISEGYARAKLLAT